MPDWYERNMDARLAWHVNFQEKLVGGFALKYGIPAAVMTQVAADVAWMQSWVPVRKQADVFRQQLTKYFNDISGNDITLDVPNNPLFELSEDQPPTPPPGIEFRTREIARQIRGHLNYAIADGEALGIVAPEATERVEGELIPEFTFRTLANFELEVTFRRKGTDALKFQFRYKGGEWQTAGFLLTSPGTITVAPQELGVAQQVEFRAIFMRKNQEIGNYSDTKNAFIAP